jgi:cytochrome c biogenesis protein CcmG, thiol:disulfide interchange protein DsbE
MSNRMNITRVITILVLFVAAIAMLYTVVTFKKDDTVVLKTGQAAPDFTVQTLDGKTVKLSDYKGKVVMLNFWATWCEDCRTEMPELIKTYEEHKDQGLVILGVDIKESQAAVKTFADTNDVNYPIVMDKDGAVALDEYKVKPIPTTFFIDRDGVLRNKTEAPMTKEYMESTLKPLLDAGR